MTYEVNPDGRADSVPGTEAPDDDPNVMAPRGLISLADITLPGAGLPAEDWREPWALGAHPEWTGDR